MTKTGKVIYSYPSVFGSHKSMINQEKSDAMNDPTQVVLTDEYGDYTTFIDRLDTGLADPNRYAVSRLGKLFDRKKDDEA